jgi:hypothetical protein
MALPPTFDPNDLRQAGWGVIFAPNAYQAARPALEPLLEWRRQQSGDLYREFAGDNGYRTGEGAGSFLSRHGIGLGRVSPDRVPYYLLLVGSPADIPYRFQQQLDLNYAVGRLHFDDIIAYHRYATGVRETETSPGHERQMSLFAPRFPGDTHTATTVDELVLPMLAELQERARGWRISSAIGDQATKARLGAVLNGDADAALLFAASHAAILPDSHPLFDARHGALVCADWPGPPNANAVATGVAPGPGMRASFGRDDLAAAGKGAPGRMAILWSSFSAGSGPLELRPNASQRSLVAPLAQALLGAPSGGMLAVIGFVDRMLGFSSPRLAAVDRYREAVSRAIWMLLTGTCAGFATQNFDEAYAELSVALSAIHEKRRYGQEIDPAELAGLWAATNDMRNVILLGDPAVRLPAGMSMVA